MATARFQTDNRLWLVAAGCLFAALGFVDPVAGVAKGNNCLWAYVTRFVTGEYFCSTLDILGPIAMYSAYLAVPAGVVGWVVQAVVVVARSPNCKAGSGSRAEPAAEADRDLGSK